MEHCLFLSNDGSLIDDIIDWDESAIWAHCGWLRLSDGWTFSAQLSGIKWRPPNPKDKLLKLSADGTEAALSKALSMDGRGYDILGILGIALGQDWATKGTDFCSQLVIWAYDQVGCPLVNMKFIPLEHMKPSYILLGQVLEL